MKLDLNDKQLEMFHYMGMINHSDEKHKNHHVKFERSDQDNLALFYCIDCEKSFFSNVVVE
jgi:hypothetical protein